MSYSAKYLLDEMSFRRNRIRRNVMTPSLETCLQKFSRVEVYVYPRVGTFKHIAEAESSNAYMSAMEVWLFNPLCSNGLSHTDFYLFI